MALNRRTYRVVDGERIEGTWRPVFIRNGGNYYLTDLLIFADGAINCWDWVDLDGFRHKLATGWVATHLKPGAQASAHHLASWRFDEPCSWVTAEELLGEVADEIDNLNGRPDSTARCLQLLDRYLETRQEHDRQALAAAYLAIPEHLRTYALGDMDARDWPLRVLSTQIGDDLGEGEPVTEDARAQALEYFEQRELSVKQWQEGRPADGPDQPQDPTVKLASIPGKFPTKPGIECLRNEFPIAITIGARTYASAVHAYWSLATTDEAARAAIRSVATYSAVENAAGKAPIRPDWPHLRLAAMHMVLRAKFGQHPEIAQILAATGDARIDYNISSAYWSGGANGRNWLGRLLELVRSEIIAQRSGLIA